MPREQPIQPRARIASGLAAASVLAGAVCLWLISGVGAADVIRYVAYEAVFVLGPGWLAFRALSPGTRGLGWQLALGWPLGLVLEILAFALTAALDLREAFVLYPILAGALAGLAWRRRRAGAGERPAGRPTLGPRQALALAGLCLFVFAYIGIAYFGRSPLPGSVPAAFYYPDISFNLVLASEALHHWPIAEAKVVGGTYGYHYFVNIHMAAASQVTGIELPTIIFRLYLLPLIALLVLQLGLVGGAIARLAWAGPVTAALFVLVGEIDLSVIDIRPFQGVGPIPLWSSPTQLLGLVFFVPIVFVLHRLIDGDAEPVNDPEPAIPRPELWALLVLLLVGSGGAKAVIPPMLIGGLLIYLAYRLVRGRGIDRAALTALGCCVAVQLAYMAVLYRSGGSSLQLDPGATFEQMIAVTRALDAVGGEPGVEVVFWVLAVPIATAMFYGASLLGLAWLTAGRATVRPADSALLAICLAGLPAFLLLGHDGHSQLYFPLYGILAALPLAAEGLCRLFTRLSQPPAFDRRLLLAALVAWVLGLVLVAFAAERVTLDGHPVRADLIAYGSAAAALAAVTAIAVRSRGVARSTATALAVLGVLLAAAIDAPLDALPETLRRLDRGEPLHLTGPIETRRAAIEGMEWMRESLDEDAVLAVSNDRSGLAREYAPLDNTFPAFTERRTLLEGWAYTSEASRHGQAEVIARRFDPFPERRELERRVFARADTSALRELRSRYGLTHLVIDRKHGFAAPSVRELGRVVFENELLEVIELDPPDAGAGPIRSALLRVDA
ncbi:MAG: hypothetical protein FJW90_04075 [Actinobacteria bacterium]|nr:hypothetical protein [Actinomycetota bacterium]